MTSNDMTPVRHTGPGGWFIAILCLAFVGAIVLIPAILHIVFGIFGALFGLIFGLVGAAVAIVAALFTSGLAVVAVLFGLAFAMLPLLLVVAVLVGLGFLFGRSAHHG